MTPRSRTLNSKSPFRLRDNANKEKQAMQENKVVGKTANLSNIEVTTARPTATFVACASPKS